MRVWGAVAVAVALASCGAPAGPPCVLLVTIDTLRPDALGWIAGRNDTPGIDALARDGARFRTVVTPAPLTLPAHASLMTGLEPRRHGVRDNGQVVPLGPATLAEILRGAGYDTAAFVSGYPLRALFGLDRGFGRYDDVLPVGAEGWLERPAADTTAAALAWVRAARRPWFLWVHYYDPHDPYTAHAAHPRSGPRAAYDSEVAYADAGVGELVRGVQALGTGSVLTVLTADHAESFGEHGEWLHGFFAYDTTVVVPLVVHFPGRVAPADVAPMVRLIDVAPTFEALVGLPARPGLDGASLVPLLDGRSEPPRTARVEALQPWLTYGWAPLRAVRTDAWKLVEAPRPELYDLRRDPGETSSVLDDRAADAATLRAELAPLEGEVASRPTDPEALKRLEALGYVTTATSMEPAEGLPDPKDRRAERDALLAAEALLRRGSFEDAVARFDAVLATDPENPFAILRSGTALLKAGDVAGAIPRLERAVRVNPAQPETRYALADALTRDGRYEAAVAEWRETTRLQPRRAAAWSNLGTVLALVGRVGEARTALERAVEIEPTDGRLLENLALVERRAGDESAAAAHLARAAERAAPEFALSGTLGLMLGRLGRPDEARPWLERAKPGEPEFAPARLALARDRALAGERAAAIRALDEALGAAPALRARAAADPALAQFVR